MSSHSQYSVVVPAAGIGKRMQADCPKQYLQIAGKTIIEHTLTNLLAHKQIKASGSGVKCKRPIIRST